MTTLAKKACVACSGHLPPLGAGEISAFLKQVPGWTLISEGGISKIERTFTFSSFKEALAFVNTIAGIAEAEGHHPDILIHSFRHVKLMLYTHAIKGLHENDFIVAAKVDQLAGNQMQAQKRQSS